jgi:hypothetical protein
MSAKLIAVIYIALVSNQGAVAAQSTQRAPADADKEITVTGCLAQGADATHYSLLKATPPQTVGTTGATATTGSTAAPGTEVLTVTYDLVGGTDLKAHLGHKVEVTGTAIPPSAAKTTDTAKEPAPRNAMGRGSEFQGAMNVKSVKMIASSCS